MKISISNIAWNPSEEDAVAQIMADYGIRGVEIAPTKIWAAPDKASDDSVREYRNYWASRKVQIVALQSLLFGKAGLEIFTSQPAREATFNYLSGIIGLASKLGAQVLVFGSPRNRLVREMDSVQVLEIALDFFSRIGEVAARHEVCFCIEPNPAAYGCDFICTAAEGRELVRRVNHSGFRLHLDTAAMTLNGESYEEVIEDCFEWLEHFHISEPQLGAVGRGSTDHARIAQRLRALGYDRWVSIEMRDGWTIPNTEAVRTALEFVTNTYR